MTCIAMPVTGKNARLSFLVLVFCVIFTSAQDDKGVELPSLCEGMFMNVCLTYSVSVRVIHEMRYIRCTYTKYLYIHIFTSKLLYRISYTYLKNHTFFACRDVTNKSDLNACKTYLIMILCRSYLSMHYIHLVVPDIQF